MLTGPAPRYCPLLGGLVWRLADVERHLIYHVFEILGAAFLCGIGDPLSLLTANHAFPGSAYAIVAKIGVWACSAFAALLGALTLLLSPPPVTEAQRADCQHPRPVMKGDSNAGVGQNGRVIPSGNVPPAHSARRPIDRARNLGDAARARNARQ